MDNLHLAKCKKTNYSQYNGYRKKQFKRARRRFEKNLIGNMAESPKDIAKVINDNFWDML